MEDEEEITAALESLERDEAEASGEDSLGDGSVKVANEAFGKK